MIDSCTQVYETINLKIKDIPENDSTAIISRWRLEKPLKPTYPELNEREKQEANMPSGKFIPRPDEFIAILEEKSPEHAKAYKIAVEFSEAVKEAGGRVLLVGGSVRDVRSGLIPKDFDIEIYGLQSEEIGAIAEKFGEVDQVGAAFGILKLHIGNGMDLDLSQPRIDSQNSPDHKNVESALMPDMPIKEACRRRDFTINAMAADILTGELFDFFGGDQDLQDGILKVTDERLFCDDPLRVMRGMQFIGRLGLSTEPRTEEIMELMVFELDRLPKDRFFQEWSKLLLKSQMPSLGLMKGAEIGVFKELYPDFAQLTKTKQDPEWHPEGNAWIHSLISTDKALEIIKRQGLSGDDALAIMLAVFCHDLGKGKTTEEQWDGKISSHGHEAAGKEPTLKFLEQIGASKKMAKKIAVLTANHMAPVSLYAEEVIRGNRQDNAVRRLAGKLAEADATIEELVLVAEADQMGRFRKDDPEFIEQLLFVELFPAGKWLVDKFAKFELKSGKPADLIDGRVIISFGFKGGPHIAEIKNLANRLHDEKGFDKEAVLAEIYKSVKDNGIDEPSVTTKYLQNLLK